MDLLKPSVPFYTFQLPNADTIVSILPFILFGILLLTVIFASFISYQQLLFVPDETSNISYPYPWIGLIPIALLLVILFGSILFTTAPAFIKSTIRSLKK